MGVDLMLDALKALNDGYQQDIHTEVISLVNEIYSSLAPVSPDARDTFLRDLGVPPDTLQTFESELMSKSTAKERQLIVRQFLQGITGVAVSQTGAIRKSSFVLNIPDKLFAVARVDEAVRGIAKAEVESRENVVDEVKTLFGDEE
ncbi:hypothetical protein HK096_002123 [Nowakowskiella sp. JEL0078]|nr:hypothetical protein HK096_002123 [Nowakowskiella sp. JEL0078]